MWNVNTWNEKKKTAIKLKNAPFSSAELSSASIKPLRSLKINLRDWEKLFVKNKI